MRLAHLFLALLFPCVLQAQRQCVVVDAVSHSPVAHASLYAKYGGKFRAAITDSGGRAVVSFPFRRLTVSHLNYEKRQLTSVPDTVWLLPKSYVTSEVVVTSKEPAWIRPMLKRFVKNKGKLYLNRIENVGYDYVSQSIDTNRVYRYHSKGTMLLPSPKSNRYFMYQREGVVYSADTMRLTDTGNLRRILYEDFVANFDNGFIRNHRFFVNGDYVGKANEVQLVFRNPKHPDDRGSFVIDTARCVVLRASGFAGLQYNLVTRVSKLDYRLCRFLTGYNIDEWTVDYHVEYQCYGGNWFIGQAGYKIDMHAFSTRPDHSEDEFHRQTAGGWGHMEATLSFSPHPPSESLASDEWLKLPPSWYIGMPSDTNQENEISLSNLPSEWREWGEDERE